MEKNHDLEERLLEYAAQIIRLVERLPSTRTGNHIAGQLLRSGTSPLANHAEAESAESRRDFAQKLRICHKELRETSRWLRLIERIPLLEDQQVRSLSDEAEELIRIFAASLQSVAEQQQEAEKN